MTRSTYAGELHARHLFAEIKQTIATIVSWDPVVDPNMAARGALAWEGRVDGWRVLVCTWPLADGSEGTDGTAIHSSTLRVVHLTPELAAMAAKKAKGTP